jgi:transposase
MSETNPKSARKRGRQPDASSKSGQIRALLSTGMSVSEIAKKVGCTPALAYNVKARMSTGPRRGPGRPPKATKSATSLAGMTNLDGLQGIIQAVKGAETQRAQLRTALERIQTIIADALR